MIRSAIRSVVLCMLVLAGAEAALWVFGGYFASPIRRFDNRGFHYTPNLRAAYMDNESGLLLRFETNASGANDSDWPDDGRPRIAFIGNSYTDSRQVPHSRRFSERTGDLLRAAGVVDAVTMNLGADGQQAVHYINQARFAAANFKPDAFVVLLNDWSDFNQHVTSTVIGGEMAEYVWNGAAAELRTRPLTQREIWVRKTKDTLKLFWLPRAGFRFMGALSNVVQEFKGALNRFSPRAGQQPEDICGRAFGDAGDDAQFHFDVTVEMLKHIEGLSDAAFVAVQIPNDDSDEVRAECDRSRPKRLMAAAAQKRGFDLVQTHEAFEPPAPPGHYPHGHLNIRGHETVARMLAPVLARRLTGAE